MGFCAREAPPEDGEERAAAGDRAECRGGGRGGAGRDGEKNGGEVTALGAALGRVAAPPLETAPELV